MTADNHQTVAPPQQTNIPPSGGAPPNAFADTTSQQQAYVIAAHAVQTNAMSLLSAAQHFGVDFVTLRRFCRRIEKTIGKPLGASSNSPAAPIDLAFKRSSDQMPTNKVHKKQKQMSSMDREIMLQEKMIAQQQTFLANTALTNSSSVALKDDRKSSPASKLDTSGGGVQHTRRPRQIFSLQQEEELANFVRETSAYYNGMSSKDVRTLAFVYAVCNRVEIPTGWQESSQASFDWCLGFIKRNKLSPMMTTSNMYKVTQDKSLNGKGFGELNAEAEIAEC